MFYKPAYCSHCGEKIDRAEWKFWTSTRFCENCETEFRKVDWMPRIILLLAAIGGIFAFGSYLKTPEKSANLAANQFAFSSSNKIRIEKSETSSANTNVSNLAVKPDVQANIGTQNQTKSELTKKQSSPIIRTDNTQNPVSEPVYFCGAQTKKGTPCTRKVKGGGRCWQHEGLPAMLPKEKLVSSQ